jgi:hypothetical protein
MITLPKRMELVRAVSFQLKILCEAIYAASILKHMWVAVCQCMGKFASTSYLFVKNTLGGLLHYHDYFLMQCLASIPVLMQLQC